MATIQATVNIGVTAPAVSAPAWFVNATDNAWGSIAGSVGQRLRDVADTNASGDINSILNAWNSLAVDDANRRLAAVRQGGHGDRNDTSVYVLDVTAETPAWSRTKDTTSSTAGGSDAWNGSGDYSNGEPRAVHGYYSDTVVNGVNYQLSTQAMSASGFSTCVGFSYDLDVSDGSYTNLGNFQSGLIAQDVYHLGGGQCYDPVTDSIFAFAQAGNNGRSITRYNVTNGTFDLINHPTNPGYNWVVCDPVRRLLIVGGVNNRYYCNIDTDISGTNVTWSTFSTNNNGAVFGQADGAVFWNDNGSILCWGNNGTTVYEITIPADLDTQWTVTARIAAAGGLSPAGPQNGTWGKFRIINDMGNGQACLFLANDVDNPTYFYKLPAVT